MNNQPLSSNDHAQLLIFLILFAPSIFFLVGVIPALILGLGIFQMKKNQSFSSIQTAVKYFKGYATLILIGCAIAAIYQTNNYVSQKNQILNNIKTLPVINKEPDLDYISQAARNVFTWAIIELGPEPTSELEIDILNMSPLGLSLKYGDLSNIIISSDLKARSWAASKSSQLDRLKKESIFYSTISVIALAYLLAVNFLFLKPLLRHKEWVIVNGIFSASPKVTSNAEIKSGRKIIKNEKYKSYSVADELIKWAKLKEDGHITEEQFQEFKDNLLK